MTVMQSWGALFATFVLLLLVAIGCMKGLDWLEDGRQARWQEKDR